MYKAHPKTQITQTNNTQFEHKSQSQTLAHAKT